MLPCDRLAYQDGMVSKALTGEIVRRVLLIAALAPVVVLCTTILWVYQRADEEPDVKGPSVGVIVASHDLLVGTTLDEHDIEIIIIAQADLPPGAPRRRSEVLAHRVVVPIAKGTFIFPSQLQH